MDLPFKMQCSQEAVKSLVNSTTLIIKGRMLIFLNTILRKDFLKSTLSVQVVTLCTPGQCWKTSFLRGSTFMPEESTRYIGCLKQQGPE